MRSIILYAGRSESIECYTPRGKGLITGPLPYDEKDLTELLKEYMSEEEIVLYLCVFKNKLTTNLTQIIKSVRDIINSDMSSISKTFKFVLMVEGKNPRNILTENRTQIDSKTIPMKLKGSDIVIEIKGLDKYKITQDLDKYLDPEILKNREDNYVISTYRVPKADITEVIPADIKPRKGLHATTAPSIKSKHIDEGINQSFQERFTLVSERRETVDLNDRILKNRYNITPSEVTLIAVEDYNSEILLDYLTTINNKMEVNNEKLCIIDLTYSNQLLSCVRRTIDMDLKVDTMTTLLSSRDGLKGKRIEEDSNRTLSYLWISEILTTSMLTSILALVSPINSPNCPDNILLFIKAERSYIESLADIIKKHTTSSLLIYNKEDVGDRYFSLKYLLTDSKIEFVVRTKKFPYDGNGQDSNLKIQSLTGAREVKFLMDNKNK